MSPKSVCILAVDPSVLLSKTDRDRLRRAGVIVIHADPDKVRAIDPIAIAPLISGDSIARAAVETLRQNWNYVDAKGIRADFGKRVLDAMAAGTQGERP